MPCTGKVFFVLVVFNELKAWTSMSALIHIGEHQNHIEAHLSSMFKQNPKENESDLYFVDNSINHPTRRPKAPIAITRIIFADLHS